MRPVTPKRAPELFDNDYAFVKHFLYYNITNFEIPVFYHKIS